MYAIYSYVYGIDLEPWIEKNMNGDWGDLGDFDGFESDYSGDSAPLWMGKTYGSIDPRQKVPPTYPDQTKLDADWAPILPQALKSLQEQRIFLQTDPWYQKGGQGYKIKQEGLDAIDKLEIHIKATKPSKIIVYTTS